MSIVQERDAPDEGTYTDIVITAHELARMHASNRTPEPTVLEVLGPPQSYFEVPLDWFVNVNGEIGPCEMPGAVRLIQRIHYTNFMMLADTQDLVMSAARQVIDTVRAELNRITEMGYIWWRLHPKYELEDISLAPAGKPARHRIRMRLGTSPTLPTRFWLDLSKAVDNRSSEPLVPRG